jgi:hypothetical protein
MTQPLRGIVYHVIRPPTIRFGTKMDGGDFDKFVERVKAWYRAEGEFAKSREKWVVNPPVGRYAVEFDEPLVPEEFRALVQRLLDSRTPAPLLEGFPRNEDRCLDWHMRRCQMFDLCHSHPRDWVAILGRGGYTYSTMIDEDLGEPDE